MPRVKILSIALVAALTLVGVGCGTDGGNDGAGGDDTVSTTVATDSSDVDEPIAATTIPDEGPDPFVPSGDGESNAYVDAITRSLQVSNAESDGLVMSDDQIDCLAPRFVDILGVDRMREKGVEPADIAADDAMDFSNVDLSDEEGNALYDTFGACDVDLRESMLESMATDEDATPEAMECMGGVLSEANVRTFMVAVMVNGDEEDDPEFAALMNQLMGCAFIGVAEGE